MQRYVLYPVLLLVISLSYGQRNGSLQGSAFSENKTPLSFVNISLKGTHMGALTNTEGQFELSNIPPGSYTLVASFVGYKTYETPVIVSNSEVLTVQDIILLQKDEQLEEVYLNADKKTNPFVRKESVYVAKLPLKDIENPQVYNAIGSELLKEQIITNFDDALKNAPGLDKLWESTGRGSDGAGYFSLRGFPVQPTMLNGLPGLTNGSPDPANIETIEVIKGPSGTLYGSSLISYGGLININTKRPYDYFGGNISYTSGSYGLNRVTADVNTPLSDDKPVYLRLNAAYHTQNSFQDAGFRKSLFVAPSLSYDVNDKLSFFINTEFYNGKSTNQTMLFLDRGAPLRVTNIDELGYDRKRSYTGNDLYLETPTFSFQGQMNYKISDSWTSQTVYSRFNAKSDGYYSYLYEITRFTPVTEGIVLQRYLSKQNSETIGTDLQQNFIGDFKIGNMRNRLVVGLDYFKRSVINNSSPYVANGMIYIGDNLQQFNEDVLGNSDPATFTDETGILTQAGTDALLANSQITPSKTEQEVFSAYASNIINLLPQLSAMASIRVDRFSNDSYNQTAFSPKFGLVYQPLQDKVSLFANYMDGFSNLAPVSENTNGVITNRALNPEHARQFEFGTKVNLFKELLSATFSYYDIKVSDKSLRVDVDAQNYYYTQDGEQKSKGFEASVFANPLKGWNIVAGYSYNDSKLTAAAVGNDFLGRRPESAGPQNLVNFWTSYKFNGGSKLDGFGLGFGGNYGSENKIFNRNLGGTFTLPEYLVLNATAFYTLENFRIALKLDNLTDEEYYKGWSTVSPQLPRTMSANITYSF